MGPDGVEQFERQKTGHKKSPKPKRNKHRRSADGAANNQLGAKVETIKSMDKQGLTLRLCSGKKCLDTGWPDNTPTAAQLIKRLKENPSLNIALAMHENQYIDVECDSDEAEANLSKMFNGKIPKTPAWQSARGKHRLFQQSGGLPKKSVLHLDGVEFRIGNGGGCLSVLPPSDGREWLDGQSLLDDVEFARLPSSITKRLKAKDKASQKSEPNSTVNGKIEEVRVTIFPDRFDDSLFCVSISFDGVATFLPEKYKTPDYAKYAAFDYLAEKLHW